MGIQPTTHTGDNMSESSKSGYDIRKELLHLSVGILSDNRKTLFQNEMMKEDGSKKEPIAPYTLQEVIDQANALYEFVKTK